MKLSEYIKRLQKIKKEIGDAPLLEYKFVIPSGGYGWWRCSRNPLKNKRKMSAKEFNSLIKAGDI